MWSKVFRVMRTEYMNIIRTKAFIISVVLMPLLMGGSIVVQSLVRDRSDVKEKRIAVIDQSEGLFGAIQAASVQRNESGIWTESGGERRQNDAKWIFELSDAETVDLSNRVRSGELFAFVIIPQSVFLDESTDAVAYHTNTPTYDALPRWLGAMLNEVVRRHRFGAKNIDLEQVDRLSRPVPLRKYGLVELTAEGKTTEAAEVNEMANFIVPMGAMMLLFMLVMMAGPAQMNSVLEEKMQRISEILVSSVSPFELFLGKLCGNVLVSWTLSVLYLGGIAFLSYRFGFAELIPAGLFFWFGVFQLLALFIFGSIFSGLGAACSELRDAQTMMMPAMMLVMIPMFTWLPVVKSPNGTLATVLSLIPPAAPFILLLRMAVPPGPPGWEVLLAVAICLVFTVLCVWAAGRIFRVGVLSQGQAPGFRKLFRWVFSE